MRRPAVLALALFAGLLAGEAVATAQAPTVRVRAETRIELRVTRGPGPVAIAATLRDDLGAPLPDRQVEIRVVEGASGQTMRETRTTGSDGSATVSFDLAVAQYRVIARYDGDEQHQRIEVEQQLDLERAHVRLRVTVGNGRLDLDEPSHGVDVTAASDVGGGDLAVEVLNELGQSLARGSTNAAGRANFTIASDRLGEPAAGRIIVRTLGDPHRAAAQTEVPVVRFRPTRIELSASTSRVRPDEPLEIEGRLFDSAGPIARRAVGVFAGEEHEATLLTDDRGRFSRELDLEGHEASVEITARYESDAPWRTSARSAPIVITIEGRGGTPWPWLLVPTLICAIAVALLSRRSRAERARTKPERESAAPPGIAPARPLSRAVQRADVAGSVLDADEGVPIAGARIVLLPDAGEPCELTTDAEGRFDAGTIAAGGWKLRAGAEGYEDAETILAIPHRGQWSTIAIRLRSLRHAALLHYRPVAEALAPARKWWAFWTPRELADRAEPPRPAELEPLTRAIERAAYGHAHPSPDDVLEIGSRAERVARELEEP